MKIGILADVHANLDGLRAVFAHESAAQVDEWRFLGDAVGRGPEPVETVQLLRQKVPPRHWLAGNHDLYVTRQVLMPANPVEKEVWREHYREIRAVCNVKGRRVLWEWCRRWWTVGKSSPQQIAGNGFDAHLVHGALGNTDKNFGNGAYICPWSTSFLEKKELDEQFAHLSQSGSQGKTQVLIHGHTHVPYAAAKDRGKERKRLLPLVYGQPISLWEYAACLINPGSVGQPRNGDWRQHAAFGILDSEEGSFTFYRAEYSTERVRLEMRRRKYPERLRQILEGNHPGSPLRQEPGSPWQLWERTYRDIGIGWEPINPDIS